MISTLNPPVLNPDIPKRGMPVTIITGFLGSGKTTLLNQILKNRQDLKVAVLVNEFGDINIDSQLLVGIEDDMMELSNGCICCTINEGLVDAVYRILEREDRIDCMVIETTGIADPLPIALTFLGTDLKHFTHLDSILTMVDAETFTPDHYNSEAAFSQITYSDIILLNKTDLVSEETLLELENFIRSQKPKARILRSQYGEVPLPLILDVDLAHLSEYAAKVKSEAKPVEKSIEHHGHEHKHEHLHEHSDHDHYSHHLDNDGFISVSFESDRPLNLEKFQNFLDKQIPDDLFRAKGIIWFRGIELHYIFQLSGKRYELKADTWKKSPKTELVLIGRNLDTELLQQQLKECQAY